MSLVRSVRPSLAFLALAAFSSAFAAQEGSERTFHGYLLATSDSRVVTKAERTIPADATRAMFDKAFSAERFRILPWGEIASS